MANNRPIRRGRFPRWRRGRMFGKPNRRWIDGNSTQAAACAVETVSLLCTPQEPRELLVGDLDIDWSDKAEVTIARVVGSILFSGDSVRTENGLIPYAVNVRAGILVTEDTDRVYQTIDMYDPESLEEFEWMWLTNILLEDHFEVFQPDGNIVSGTRATVPVDIGVKRKLGKKDSLVLYAQHSLHIASPTNFSFATNMSAQLRTVLT